MRAIKTTTISILAVGLLAGSAVGVTAQDAPPLEATEVTGRLTFGDRVATPDPVETPDGIMVDKVVVLHTWDTSDPRLTGDGTYTVNFIGAPIAAPCCVIHTEAYELTNDGGSWVGDGRAYSTETDRKGFVALNGRDGYEGLTALVATELNDDGDGWDLEGVIFPSVMPEVPEPYSAE